ncbi:serine/threonine protein phosphatase [Sphingomonas sp. SUN019]|uniref:metallophosphoesterase family protein n=1 Tax=Sphingomonas sp. SUN019 TaxID=2937788 RepID=UPI002164891B|nr:metallophosphoesterase family protein [Sphingomonas sp. SUN019]UVO49057.1 serine/threonine protein phosphatase [Sphingomonas sp. SUN019]
MIGRIFSRRRPATPRGDLPAGRRLYAIGDVHGRLDLLDDLLEQIAADDRMRGEANTGLIFLGDLIDRGPDSAGVVERVRTLCASRPDTRCLLGNHEEILLQVLGGDERATRLFCRIGGNETALSYGVTPEMYQILDHIELSEQLSTIVPESHRAFLGVMEDLIVEGDYAFVHAGVRPGVPFDEQKPSDLRWIRERFLDYSGALERIVVHGHTIRADVEELAHRIGIDTGAYATGVLTAIGLEGDRRWFLQTAQTTQLNEKSTNLAE